MLASKSPELVDRAIQSVVAQDYQKWELLVVQDGPNERIERVVREWVDREDRIRHFQKALSDNVGAGYNFGVERARGEYIAVLDDDDYWLVPDKLSRQVAFLDGHPDYAGCGAGMIVMDETGRQLMRCLKPEHDEKIKELALLANSMAHSTTMFRRRMNGHLARYDDSLPGLPDWDLWLNMGRRGKLYNFPEPFTGYTLWNNGYSFRRQRSNARSALQIVWRYRNCYRWFTGALALALVQCLYVYLPALITTHSFSYLSRVKKRIFSERGRR